MINSKLASYVDAMRQASNRMVEENPDYIVAPMLGSIPFIDAMAIVDRDFDPSKVVYMPASSRIKDVRKVIAEWYFNFLNDIVDFPEHFPKVMGIDETVSGQSVVRCLKHIDLATQKFRKKTRQDLMEKLHSKNLELPIQTIRDVDILTDNQFSYELGEIRDRVQRGIYRDNKDLAKEDSRLFVDIIRKSLGEKLEYKTIGIEDSKAEKRVKEYEEMKNGKRVFPVEIESIVGMDDPDYSPAKYEILEDSSKDSNLRFLPKVKEFKITPTYLAFLGNLASYVGRDPDKVAPINMKAILESSKYLSNNHSNN